MWVRRPCQEVPRKLRNRFNSRTRVGATFCGEMGLPAYDVSIHAPVWVRPLNHSSPGRVNGFQFTHPCGCDFMRGNSIRVFRVSIHAPVWVRQPKTINGDESPQFQFTHPCGCDGKSRQEPRHCKGFNSRTRVGATYRARRCLRFYSRFNSRTRVGATRA